MTRTPQFDPEELVDRLMGDELLAKKVVERFLSDAPIQLALLAESLSKADPCATRLSAHSIKGAAANAGAETISKAAERLEHLGLEGKLPEALQLLPELNEEFDSVSTVLKRFCDSIP